MGTATLQSTSREIRELSNIWNLQMNRDRYPGIANTYDKQIEAAAVRLQRIRSVVIDVDANKSGLMLFEVTDMRTYVYVSAVDRVNASTLVKPIFGKAQYGSPAVMDAEEAKKITVPEGTLWNRHMSQPLAAVIHTVSVR